MQAKIEIQSIAKLGIKRDVPQARIGIESGVIEAVSVDTVVCSGRGGGGVGGEPPAAEDNDVVLDDGCACTASDLDSVRAFENGVVHNDRPTVHLDSGHERSTASADHVVSHNRSVVRLDHRVRGNALCIEDEAFNNRPGGVPNHYRAHAEHDRLIDKDIATALRESA